MTVCGQACVRPEPPKATSNHRGNWGKKIIPSCLVLLICCTAIAPDQISSSQHPVLYAGKSALIQPLPEKKIPPANNLYCLQASSRASSSAPSTSQSQSQSQGGHNSHPGQKKKNKGRKRR